MFASLAEAAMSLDIGTLFVIAICVTSLLGLFLLFAWLQDGITALAWWGTAYLIGGFSGALWRLGDLISPPVPQASAEVLLFIAVGMIWSAARVFHGRPVLWGSMCLGAVVWLAFCSSSAFVTTETSRLIVSSVIVATYTFLTAVELWRERRKSLIRRWPAIFVPMLHGVIFLFPVALAGLSQDGIGSRTLGAGWVAVFAIEVVLYVVGAAFIVLVLAKDRTVSQYKLAAATDPLTELLNRRGFFEAAAGIMTAQQARKEPVCVLAFDLDHFKSINDRFGHNTGDATLHLFASRGEEDAACRRRHRPPGRRGVRRAVAGHVGRCRGRRQPRAPGLCQCGCRGRQPGRGDGERRGGLRLGLRRDRHAHRPRRCRALSRQDQRTRPGRGFR